jgi:ribonuclease Z
MVSKRRLAGTAAAIIVILAVAVFTLGKAPIGNWLFARAVERNVGVDQSLELPDGLHVYVCGSGSPLPDAERAGPCLAVLAGRDAFVFDAGSGSVRKLLRTGFPIDRLKAVFITHLHSDHIDGLGELLLQAWVGGRRTQPLPIYGPEGIGEIVGGLARAYEIDSGYRVAHHGADVVHPSGFGGFARVISAPPGTPQRATVWDGDGLRISVITVNHAPVAPAFGYRIDYRGRSVAISGDTIYSPNFVAASRGADVMFHEALNPQMVGEMSAALDRHGRKNAASILRDIPGYHASPDDAARAAQGARVRALVLYHLVPSIPAGFMEAAFVGNARSHFGGTLKVARDGLRVSLPAGSKSVEFNQAL